ncbi:Os01g0697400 [Oryza sativa Japonica Group]|uniref:Os01g0697400 protein n=1 Tax=Oryza sativa subsp. japonica TaxID=39947 RepID=A0A0P0V718_ORYSJ|nr:hypothetical protein EE612_005172 [Oryza sativa]BAS73863.1 Os01g0697400 [Oryza sativa Japonica Group]
MEDNDLVDEVLDSVGLHLFNNVDDIKILLDAARADLDENAAHIAEAQARLSHVRRLVGEVATAPMAVEQQQAVRAALEEGLFASPPGAPPSAGPGGLHAPHDPGLRLRHARRAPHPRRAPLGYARIRGRGGVRRVEARRARVQEPREDPRSGDVRLLRVLPGGPDLSTSRARATAPRSCCSLAFRW